MHRAKSADLAFAITDPDRA